MTSIPNSLPPLLPQQMASMLGDQSAVQAFGTSSSAASPDGAYLDLSPDALQLTAGEQVQMAQLEDDAALFGGTVSGSSFDSIPSPAMPAAAYDPTQDAANPAYADPADPTGSDWSQDFANPSFWA